MATRTAFLSRAGTLWTSPALIDGLLAYAVAMAVGVAVFASSIDSQPGPWPAYVFAVGFGLILLVRRRQPVLVLIITSLGICVYYTLQYPPIGLALPIAAALFSAAEAGHLRISIVVSVILVGLAVYFQITEGRDVAQLLGYELPPVIALMGASLALGDGVRSRQLLRESQREQERQARLELERRANEQRNEERLRLARDLHDALGHGVAMISLQSAVAAEALPDRVPEARRAVAEIRSISLAAMADLRTTVRRLRTMDSAVELPAGLNDLPMLAEQARGNGLEVRIVESGDGPLVPDSLGRAAYRIVQEAVTNVIRHANATTAVITLDRSRDVFTVTVRDNGQGAGELRTGNGIRGMRERAAEWGGELVISSEYGAGTVVTAILPLSEPAEPQSAELRSEP
ncbi:MAG TPA: sensor histidine kinase [Propionibacteriaceae bacterium]|nr:sensor histidine kinase [Propionibacteriaceae bacterium]